MFNFGSQRSSSSSSSQPVRLDMYSSEQQDMFRSLMSWIMGNMGKAAPSYPREMYVGRTPEEQQYFDYADLMGEQGEARIKAVTDIMSGKPAYEINPELSKEYFQKSIRPGMEREYKNVTQPGISQAFAGPGYWGSARALAQGQAAEKFGENLSSTEGNLIYADELARRQSLENAWNRAASIAIPGQESVTSTLGTAGDYSRMIEQERMMADYQRWLSGEAIDGVYNPAYNPFLQLAFQALGLQPFTWGQQSSSSSRASGFNFGLNLSGMKGLFG